MIGLLDIRTIFFCEAIMTALATLVVSSLWSRNRIRSPEMGLWLSAYIGRLLAVILIVFRGEIPDFLSIIVANALIVAGALLLFIGLERYLDRRGPQLQNYLSFALFMGIQLYFTYAQPDLLARVLNLSVVTVFILGQAAWLALVRAGSEVRGATRALGMVLIGFVLAHTLRAIDLLLAPPASDLLLSGVVDALVILGDMTLWVALTFALFLMVNRQLVSELEFDIQRRERTEKALMASESKFSMAFRTSPDAVNINRLSDGLYLDVNEGFTHLMGFAATDVEGKSASDLGIWHHASDRERLVAGLEEHGTVRNLEAVFRAKDGSLRTALMSAQLIELDGEPCILSVTRDITGYRAAADALRVSEQWHRAILHTAMDGFWLADLNGYLLEVNESYCRMSGYGRDELVGMHISALEALLGQVEITAQIQALTQHRETRFESKHRRRDGAVFDVAVNIQYREDDGGRLVAFVRDITERKRAEAEILRLNSDLEERVQERTEELVVTNKELVDTNTRLEEATRAKSEFLSSMSHELRTPLNSIIGFSDILARGMAGKLEPEQQRQAQMINSSGKHLLVLVNEVLDLSAIEAGRMRIEHGPMTAADLAVSVVETLAPLAEEKGLGISWEVADDAASLHSDRTRLEQVLFNLIGNAIKFTDSGSVHLGVSRAADEVVFRVSDTGRGIAADELSRVFEEFYQVKRPDIGKSEGTGLGLSVSLRLVNLLGGRLTVESEPGAGSTFIVGLPLGAAEDAECPTVGSGTMHGV